MVVRGTIMYLLVFVLVRSMSKRQIGGIGPSDGTYALEWLGNRFPAVQRLVREPKLKLVENGRMLRRNMQAELVTTDELLAQLREKGLENCDDVSAAYMEADGHFSAIEKKS